MNPEEEVSASGDGVMIFKNAKLRVFGKNKTMSLSGVAGDVTASDSPQGASDDRVGLGFSSAEDGN
jgi:hypothetical protein